MHIRLLTLDVGVSYSFLKLIFFLADKPDMMPQADYNEYSKFVNDQHHDRKYVHFF
mgnify:CR=1 FL=1